MFELLISIVLLSTKSSCEFNTGMMNITSCRQAVKVDVGQNTLSQQFEPMLIEPTTVYSCSILS